LRKIVVAAAAIATAHPAWAEGTLFNHPWPEAGGWGQAWGDEDSPPQPSAPVSRPPLPAPAPVVNAPPPPVPVSAPAVMAPPRPTRPLPPAITTFDPRSITRPAALDQTKERDNDQPVHITADQIVHDNDLGVVTAKGRVEIAQAGRTLSADVVSYNLKQDVITSSGNVVMTEATGEVTFADYFELTGDFKNGVAHEIKVLLADHSRLAAASATRVGGTRTDFDKAVYTPCEPCRDHPERVPLWQAKAERVTHNQDEQRVEYRDVWMEIDGIPVAYTPYLSHPDPTVKRRSGFLTPTIGNSSSLGAAVSTPYYFVLSDQEDLTFSPRWLLSNPSSTATSTYEAPDNVGDSALQHVVLAGEHRWAGAYGQAKTVGSLTADRANGDLRGHVDSVGVFDLDHNWRSGWDIQRQSDDTYANVYGYRIPMDKPWLTSRLYAEDFGRRDYSVVEGFAFQGVTNTDDNIDKSPLVLPHLAYSHISMPDRWGGTWHLDGDALAYTRVEGTSADRLSQQIGWTRPLTTSLGDQYTFTTSVRADGFHSDALPQVGSAETGRVYPTVATNWRFPFINESSTLPQVITPMAMVAYSPVGGNSMKMPNEDSSDFELDEINVFRPNRLPGLDRVEGGLRGAYGFRYAAYPYRGGQVTAQLAQGWRQHTDATFAPDSGFADNLSDYLGNVTLSPAANANLFNRFRLDHDNLHTARDEVGVSAGPKAINTSLAYGYFEKSVSTVDESVFPRRHYIAASVNSAISQFWSFNAASNWDMAHNGNNLGWVAKAIYNDECFAVTTNFIRNLTSDRDYLAGYSVSLVLVFKTFGQVPLTAF